jgi:hypothetical protein
MRVLVIMKANKDSEEGKMPSEEIIAGMMQFNEDLVKSGVLLAADGLYPSAKGKRVKFGGGKKSVVDGPFAETKELVAGFWIWKVKSVEEAVEWVKRIPNPGTEESEVEIRPIFDPEDFGKELTPELRAQNDRLRAEVERSRS